MKVLWLLTSMVCSTVQAQEWIELMRTDRAVAYTQGGVSRAPSGKPAVWVYLDYARPDPNGAISARAFIEADCAGMQTRMLAVTYHSGVRSTGTVVATGKSTDWKPVPPETMQARFWMYACTGK